MENTVWLATGVSGCGRKEVLEELKAYAETQGTSVTIFDVGKILEEKAKENGIAFVEDRILNIDETELSLLRALAVQTIKYRLLTEKPSGLVFIGMHAVFEWKNNLIPGVSYADLLSLDIDGVINIVDDVYTVYTRNLANPKWQDNWPKPAALQRWMTEEELLSGIFASNKKVPMYVHARKQPIENLYSFFSEEKKRIYLSYPITAIRDKPELLEKIQADYKERLNKLFYIFNPLDIKDKTNLTLRDVDLPSLYAEDSAAMIDARTISRDYRFISQSDAVVVLYPTDKNSPGVSAEMQYAHAHQIPVFMWYTGPISPFLDEIAKIYPDWDSFENALSQFAIKSQPDETNSDKL